MVNKNNSLRSSQIAKKYNIISNKPGQKPNGYLVKMLAY